MMLLHLSLLFYLTLIKANNVKYRLSTNVKPLLYSIKLHPDIDHKNFTGQVTIRLDIKSLTESISFHSSKLNISEIYLDESKNVVFKLQEKYDLIQIFLENNRLISPGYHRIHIKYSGNFGTNSTLFQAKFDDDHKDNILIVSDFQPGFARYVFPCFDEPTFKARFSIELITPNNSYTALSNMPQIDSYRTNKGIITKFQTTYLMSTYLIAFAITNYPFSETIFNYNNRKLPIRLYSPFATNQTINNFNFLNFTMECIKFYANYTNIPFNLPKLDFIEYERNNPTGMENWGLITVQRGMLSPHKNIHDFVEITDLISHEIAHNWFGNLVTNNWWDDLWLNEGLTTFIVLKAQSYLKNYNQSEFANILLKYVYKQDRLSHAKQVVKYREIMSEIETNFDIFIYDKPAAILQMIENVISEEKFQKIIQTYLKQFAYKTTTTNDFITISENIVPTIDVLRDFIESFLYQKGFPFIKIEEDAKFYILTQIPSGYNKNSTENVTEKWTIPLTYKTNLLNQSKIIWFKKDMDKIIIPKNGENWIFFDYYIHSYYRVIYSTSLWEKLIENLNEINKLQQNFLLTDSLYLYFYNMISCEMFFAIIEKFVQLKNEISNQLIFTFLQVLFEEIYKYDTKTIDIAQEYFKEVYKKTGQNFTVLTVSDFEIDLNSTKPIPEYINSCSKWIRKNLIKLI